MTARMGDESDTLVRRVQRRLRSNVPNGLAPGVGGVAVSDVSALEARVRRLRALDDRLGHVGLSPYVEPARVPCVSNCAQGVWVTKDVVTVP